MRAHEGGSRGQRPRRCRLHPEFETPRCTPSPRPTQQAFAHAPPATNAGLNFFNCERAPTSSGVQPPLADLRVGPPVFLRARRAAGRGRVSVGTSMVRRGAAPRARAREASSRPNVGRPGTAGRRDAGSGFFPRCFLSPDCVALSSATHPVTGGSAIALSFVI